MFPADHGTGRYLTDPGSGGEGPLWPQRIRAAGVLGGSRLCAQNAVCEGNPERGAQRQCCLGVGVGGDRPSVSSRSSHGGEWRAPPPLGRKVTTRPRDPRRRGGWARSSLSTTLRRRPILKTQSVVSRGLRAGKGDWETAGTAESTALERFGNFMETDPYSALPGHVRPRLSRQRRGKREHQCVCALGLRPCTCARNQGPAHHPVTHSLILDEPSLEGLWSPGCFRTISYVLCFKGAWRRAELGFFPALSFFFSCGETWKGPCGFSCSEFESLQYLSARVPRAHTPSSVMDCSHPRADSERVLIY